MKFESSNIFERTWQELVGIMPTEQGPPDSKRSRDLLSSSDPDESFTFTAGDREMLHSIFKQLKKLDVLDELKTDVAELKKSVDFAHNTMEQIEKVNKTLKEDVGKLKQTAEVLTSENKKLKAAVLDLQCRSMRDNLLIMGIQEQPYESYQAAESLARSFLRNHLGFSEEDAKAIQIERAHRLGRRLSGKSRPIVIKLVSSKQVDHILSLSKMLKGSPFVITKQYPKEVVEKRRELFPVMISLKEQGHKVRLVLDKLYVNGELFNQNKVADK